MTGKEQADLGGVSETLLWTTYQRAVEARRPHAVLDDPRAIELVERIDYPFQERFGSRFGQWQALRARCFDREVRRFLARRPEGTVVALGEGLETQFWRVDNGRVSWLTVDVPEVIELRERLLPGSPRRRTLAGSAFDAQWIDAVEDAGEVLVTAQGLLMYFDREAVHGLIATIGRRLPAGELIFDAVPASFAARSRRGDLKTAGGFRPPPWLWGIDADEERALTELCTLEALRLPRGRGPLFGFIAPLLARIPALRRGMLTVFRARFEA